MNAAHHNYSSAGALYVLMRTVDIDGHSLLMLCRAVCRFMERLSAVLLRSLLLKKVWTVWTAASVPAIWPAHNCKDPTASCMSFDS